MAGMLTWGRVRGRRPEARVQIRSALKLLHVSRGGLACFWPPRGEDLWEKTLEARVVRPHGLLAACVNSSASRVVVESGTECLSRGGARPALLARPVAPAPPGGSSPCCAPEAGSGSSG